MLDALKSSFGKWEPARVQALWAALRVLLVGLGVTILPGVDLWVGAVLAGYAAFDSFLQAEATRKKVVPLGK